MIVLKALVTAGSSHSSYPVGFEAQANIFVDSDDWTEAEGKAKARLAELGWHSIDVKGSIRLPADPDMSGWSSSLSDAHKLAEQLGVACVVYPPRAT